MFPNRESITAFLLQGNERKIIYFEKFMAIVYMDGLQITDHGILAQATPLVEIPRPKPYRKMPSKVWDFGCTWEWLDLSKDLLHARWVGWTIWTDPSWVEQVSFLVDQGETTEAHETVYRSWFGEE